MSLTLQVVIFIFVIGVQCLLANPYTFVIGGDCINVVTSEGPWTLKHGGTACAPLLEGETDADKGKRYLVCHDSVADVLHCPAGLRFDTVTHNCNWPQDATCALQDDGSPQTNAPPTPSPVTNAPPTPSPVTNAPTTPSPVTNAPTTQRPTTNAPTTQRPTTNAPTTQRPTTNAPTTQSPGTTPNPNGPCNANTCRLPNCYCYGDRPTSIPLADMPQFLMLTFDDTVSPQFWNNYFRGLLYDNDYKLFNPTGCPLKATLYVSHADTDYTKVKALWEKGHEIASHTITHDLPYGATSADYPAMVGEIQGLKDKVLEATGNQSLVDSIVGFRAPYLRVAFDTMFDVLRDYGFKYDSSILNILALQGKTPVWPFTLDYIIPECVNPPCPTKSYPGMWEVPLNGWVGDDGQGCSMADACVIGDNQWSASQQQWKNYFKRNFDDYFYPTRVPAPVFIHGWMFGNYPNSWPALTSWLQDTMAGYGKKVWMVTPLQVIEWMKNPLSHSQMVSQGWGC